MAHHGYNIRFFRNLRGFKQEALAQMIDLEWNQKKISLLESRAVVSNHELKLIGSVLNVKVEILKEFDQDQFMTNLNDSISESQEVIIKDEIYLLQNEIILLNEKIISAKQLLIRELLENKSIHN